MLLNSANNVCLPKDIIVKATLINPNEQLLQAEKLIEGIIKNQKSRMLKVA